MKVDILKSGSSGNCVVIDDCIIIDAGYVPKNPPKGDVLLLTHAHTDHTKELGKFGGVPIYTLGDVREMVLEKWKYLAINAMGPGKLYRLPFGVEGPYHVSAVPLNHGVPCVGFDIRKGEERLLYATDFRSFEAPIDVRDYTELYLECNNTLDPTDIVDVYFGDKPTDDFHRRKSYFTHCNVSYIYDLFERAGFSEDNPCTTPITLMHKSTFYYNAHPEKIERLCRIANVQNPLL